MNIHDRINQMKSAVSRQVKVAKAAAFEADVAAITKDGKSPWMKEIARLGKLDSVADGRKRLAGAIFESVVKDSSSVSSSMMASLNELFGAMRALVSERKEAYIRYANLTGVNFEPEAVQKLSGIKQSIHAAGVSRGGEIERLTKYKNSLLNDVRELEKLLDSLVAEGGSEDMFVDEFNAIADEVESVNAELINAIKERDGIRARFEIVGVSEDMRPIFNKDADFHRRFNETRQELRSVCFKLQKYIPAMGSNTGVYKDACKLVGIR